MDSATTKLGELQNAELEAERRYDEAIIRGDHTAASRAALEWRAACNDFDARLSNFPPPGCGISEELRR